MHFPLASSANAEIVHSNSVCFDFKGRHWACSRCGLDFVELRHNLMTVSGRGKKLVRTALTSNSPIVSLGLLLLTTMSFIPASRLQLLYFHNKSIALIALFLFCFFSLFISVTMNGGIEFREIQYAQ